MQVILKEDIQHLGYKGDVVTVKPGFGRNFLIPKNKAKLATKSALKALAEENKQAAHKIAKAKEDAEAVKIQMETIELTVFARAATDGKKIYGSINTAQIQELLAEKGFEVPKTKVILKDNIRELGTFNVLVDLHKEVKAEVALTVKAENQAEIDQLQAKAAEKAKAEAAAASNEAKNEESEEDTEA